MKKLMLLAFAVLLIFGCTNSSQNTNIGLYQLNDSIAQSNHLSLENAITASGDANIAKIEIKSSKIVGASQFPLKKYENEFVSFGLYSENFIKLDKKYIKFFEHGEAIWLTAIIRNNSGVLFNAIYSKDISDCNSSVNLLGKMYNSHDLKNDLSLGNDDKWKVRLVYDNTGCPKRIILFMDGYFSDLKDNERISLFGNDNTVTLQFKDLENEPKIDMIVTKPIDATLQNNLIGREHQTYFPIEYWNETNNISSNLTNIYENQSTVNYINLNKTQALFNRTNIIQYYPKISIIYPTLYHYYITENFTETEILNDSGLYLNFEPAIPTCYSFDRLHNTYFNNSYIFDEDCQNDWNNYNYSSDSIEVDRLVLNMPNGNWVILKMRNSSEFDIAKEKYYAIAVNGYDNNTIKLLNVSGTEWALNNSIEVRSVNPAIFVNKYNPLQQFNISVGETKLVGNDFVHLWDSYSGYGWGSPPWARISFFSEFLDLTNSESNIKLKWVNRTIFQRDITEFNYYDINLTTFTKPRYEVIIPIDGKDYVLVNLVNGSYHHMQDPDPTNKTNYFWGNSVTGAQFCSLNKTKINYSNGNIYCDGAYDRMYTYDNDIIDCDKYSTLNRTFCLIARHYIDIGCDKSGSFEITTPDRGDIGICVHDKDIPIYSVSPALKSIFVPSLSPIFEKLINIK